MLDHLFNLRFAAKDLERNAKKSEKLEKEEKLKLKKVMLLIQSVIFFITAGPH